MKVCKTCKKEKSLEHYPKCKSGKDGYRIHCYECCNKQKQKSSLKVRKLFENNHIHIESKFCYVCKNIKNVSEFYKNKSNKDGFTDECKICIKERNKKKWYENKIKNRIIPKEGFKICSCCKKELELFKFHNDPKGKMGKNSQCKSCYLIKTNLKRRTDIRFWMKGILRKRLLDSVKKCTKKDYKKISRAVDLLGCDLNFLKIHLEQKFRDGMSWENRGQYWHIDHIIPCSHFDLSKIEEQKKCFHYTNLQPLLVHENLKKSNKLLYT